MLQRLRETVSNFKDGPTCSRLSHSVLKFAIISRTENGGPKAQNSDIEDFNDMHTLRNKYRQPCIRHNDVLRNLKGFYDHPIYIDPPQKGTGKCLSPWFTPSQPLKSRKARTMRITRACSCSCRKPLVSISPPDSSLNCCKQTPEGVQTSKLL